jgi:hypothetical protein
VFPAVAHAKLCVINAIALLTCAYAWTQVADEPKAGDARGAIVLPKDPKAVVVTFDPGPNGIRRKGPAPYLSIPADGQVYVTGWLDESKKETKPTPKQLEDLLRFIVQDNDFFNIRADKITAGIAAEQAKGVAVALGGVGTPVISVQVNDKRHEVSYRGADEYLRIYAKIRPLAQLVAAERRLSDLAALVLKGK